MNTRRRQRRQAEAKRAKRRQWILRGGLFLCISIFAATIVLIVFVGEDQNPPSSEQPQTSTSRPASLREASTYLRLLENHPDREIREQFLPLAKSGRIPLSIQNKQILYAGPLATIVVPIAGQKEEYTPVILVDGDWLTNKLVSDLEKQVGIFHEYQHIKQIMRYSGDRDKVRQFLPTSQLLTQDEIEFYFTNELEAHRATATFAQKVSACQREYPCRVYRDGGEETLRWWVGSNYLSNVPDNMRSFAQELTGNPKVELYQIHEQILTVQPQEAGIKSMKISFREVPEYPSIEQLSQFILYIDGEEIARSHTVTSGEVVFNFSNSPLKVGSYTLIVDAIKSR